MNETRLSTGASPAPSRRSRIWPRLQWVASVAIVTGLLTWLLLSPERRQEGPAAEQTGPPPAVDVAGPGIITLDLQTAIGKKIALVSVQSEIITEPLLQVTGSILASRRPGVSGNPDYWQFSTAELLGTYTEFEKATADVDFSTAQLARLRELAATKESSLQREIERSERLVQSGTEAARDLALQRTSLLETRISNQRDLYEAETAIKTAQRNRTAASTQLLQAGLDPEMLQAATNDVDIVAAEVPEGKIGLVSVGQACTASFFGIPDHEFRGRVAALSPVLSSEYRTLRVLFIIHDPEDQLRPGMFAAIGLGSDPRPVIRIPAESVIHIDRDDYVLRVCSPEDGVALKPRSLPAELERLQLQGSAIEVAENVQGRVEVLKGLQPGDQIASGAVILLKPTLTAALKDSAARAARLLPERHAH